MSQFNPRFESNLAAIGAKVNLAEIGESLAGASSVDPSRSYLISPVRDGGFTASLLQNGAPAEESLYKGASREEAALACLCREAQVAGLETRAFRNAETGVVLRDSNILLKGSRYSDDAGNAIEVDSADARKFHCFDKSGARCGTFSSASLAASYLSVFTALTGAGKAPAAADKASVLDAKSYTLDISKRPTLTTTADGFALLVLTGTEKTATGERPRSIPVRGDQARVLDVMFRSRSFDKPVQVVVDATLKPQRVFDASTGRTRTALVAEARNVRMVAARAKQSPDLAA